jgi:glycine/D-amino acid oxidase-like deaminating enzyme
MMNDNLPQDTGETSLWADSAIESPVFANLQESLQADVLVVGGGYSGLSSALHLAEQGVSVALLEARLVGFGGSGRSAGLVNTGVWKTPDYVIKQLGQEAGDRFNMTLRDSPAAVFDLVRRHQIECNAIQSGTVNIAHRKAAMPYLEDRCEQMTRLGCSTRMIDGKESQSISGSPVYCHGGILDPNAGTIQPLSYVRGLAIAAAELGAGIYQQSPLLKLSRDGNRWLAKTESGQVLADQVILATNAYADQNSEAVRESTLPVYIFHCATDPLTDSITEAIIPQRHGIWDTQVLKTSSRFDTAGRLVMSSVGSLQGAFGSSSRDWMMRTRNRLYPQTRGIPWTYQWTGQVGMTSTKLLRIQCLASGVFAPAGYNGRGIGPGTVIGKYLAQMLVSGNRNEFPFPIEDLHREAWRGPRSAYYKYGTLALQIIDRR